MKIEKSLLALVAILGFSLGAQAGPAMFNASFVFHAWGNDITSGTVSGFNTAFFFAAPVGENCGDSLPSTPNGSPFPNYCSATRLEQGYPATGSGTLLTGNASVGAGVGLPQSAVGVTVTGFLVPYDPYIQTQTYASFANAAGNFFAGGGPAAGAAGGKITHSGKGQRAGTWIINEGQNGFGGAMGMLGRYGGKQFKYVVAGKAGTYVGVDVNWNMVTPLGRPQSVTPYSYTAMGKTKFYNPHTVSNMYTNNLNGNASTVVAFGTGTPWTTGKITMYVPGTPITTILVRSGFDTTTGTGTAKVRNLQLVTPGLTHWIGPGFQGHTGHIGILTLQITPEPRALLLLAAGGGALIILHLLRRRA